MICFIVTVLTPVDGQGGAGVPLAVKSVLPPIGGQEKTPLPSDQAGNDPTVIDRIS